MRKYIFLLVMFVLTFCSCGEKGTTYSETDFNGEGVFGALPQMSARMSSVLLPNFGFQSCYVEIAVPYKTPISVLKDPDGATQKNIEFCRKMDKVTRIKIVKALDAPKFLETER